MLRIGYGKACITPEESVPLAGYGNTAKRMSTNVRDDIFATCVAFTDANDSTVLLFTLDMLHAHVKWTEGIREAVTEACGIPGDRIMVAHTHTHAAPDAYNSLECTERYRLFLAKRCREAAEAALADRCPGQLYAGIRTMQNGMNFIRNYIKDESGNMHHADEPDRRLQLVKVVREGTRDILLMNWQAHPCFTGGLKKPDISADYIGDLRKYMEERTGDLFAFFQGASGNVTTGSKLPGERITNDCATYASLLGEWSMLLYDALEPVAGDSLCFRTETLKIPIDHSDDHLVEEAKVVRDFWVDVNDYPICTKFANEHGFNSVYHASGVISRASRGESADMELNVFSVGDISFVCAPFEMYSVNGSFIKDHSPFAMTFIVTSCNTLHGYLAEDKAFDYGCYEVDFRRYPRGTAEKVAEHFTQMLTTLKNA